MDNDTQYMKMAIQKAKEGINSGQTPFGAVIVMGDKVVACEHNLVFKNSDITAHAEVVAIQKGCQSINKIDLKDAVIYSTCEPCPMCFSAIHWANIKKIVYGASIEDAQKAGFREMKISNFTLKKLANLHIEIKKDFLKQECIALFDDFNSRYDKRVY